MEISSSDFRIVARCAWIHSEVEVPCYRLSWAWLEFSHDALQRKGLQNGNGYKSITCPCKIPRALALKPMDSYIAPALGAESKSNLRATARFPTIV